MKNLRKALVPLLILALCAALSPASAQTGIEGAWQSTSAYGTSTMIFGATGAYISFAPNLQAGSSATTGLWQGDGMTLDAGRYTLEGGQVNATNQAGMSTWWRYSVTGDTLYLLHEPSGIYFYLYKITLAVPAGMGGDWEDEEGEFSLSLYDDGTFLQEYDSGDWYWGVYMADANYLTLAYDDGDAYLCRYTLGQDSLLLYDSQMAELLGSLVRPAPEPTPTPEPTAEPLPEPTAEPAATHAPKFNPGPAVVTQAPASQTEPPVPVTEAPATDVPPDATEAPAALTEAPAPATEAPILQAETPMPESEEPPVPTDAAPAAAGLAGRWRGTDAAGTKLLLLTPEGVIETSYEEAALSGLAKKGTYTWDATVLQAAWEDGTAESFRYILMGDSLLLSGPELQNPVTYTRQPAEN